MLKLKLTDWVKRRLLGGGSSATFENEGRLYASFDNIEIVAAGPMHITEVRFLYGLECVSVAPTSVSIVSGDTLHLRLDNSLCGLKVFME